MVNSNVITDSRKQSYYISVLNMDFQKDARTLFSTHNNNNKQKQALLLLGLECGDSPAAGWARFAAFVRSVGPRAALRSLAASSVVADPSRMCGGASCCAFRIRAVCPSRCFVTHTLLLPRHITLGDVWETMNST